MLLNATWDSSCAKHGGQERADVCFHCFMSQQAKRWLGNKRISHEQLLIDMTWAVANYIGQSEGGTPQHKYILRQVTDALPDMVDYHSVRPAAGGKT